MSAVNLIDEIREMNLSYLMLAQHMVRLDKAAAVFRLGISQQLAEIIATLTPAQVLKMSSSNMLLCRLRFDDGLILNLLTSHDKPHAMAQSHAAILLAGEPVEAVA